MELIYLLASIVSTSVTSLVHSAILFFRRPRAAAGSYVALYEGTVWHERRRPVHHSFQYQVRYALVDLDLGPVPADHLSGDEARGISQTNGRILLLTIPASVGYQQNPLSLYYCYDGDAHLKKCIAEVTNTPWGERVSFLFNPNSDTVAKPLHVSPFMDMMGSWTIKANSPEENLSVAICVEHPELGNYFTATLRAKRTSTQVAGDPAWFFWLMPHKVAIWIYWHEFPLSNIQDITSRDIKNRLYLVTTNFKLKLVVPTPMLLKRVKIPGALHGEMPNGPGAEEEDSKTTKMPSWQKQEGMESL